MLKYLVIILDDTSVAFCNYTARKERRLISIENLKKAIKFALLENLNVQFVWPEHELPEEYLMEISGVEHVNITSATFAPDADIIVAEQREYGHCPKGSTVVARLHLNVFLETPETLFPLFDRSDRVNIVIEGSENFRDTQTETYRRALQILSSKVSDEVMHQHKLQVNILTDRITLSEMKNCNAGYESITVAPDGNFYVCPAFYYAGSDSVGSVETGLKIENPQLYKIEYSPICKNCDAWHCKRCVWLNYKKTLEVNTPGRGQCLMSHLERNVSKELIDTINGDQSRLHDCKKIEEIDYLDPFDKLLNKLQ